MSNNFKDSPLFSYASSFLIHESCVTKIYFFMKEIQEVRFILSQAVQ